MTGYRKRCKPEKFATAKRFRNEPAAGEAEMWNLLRREQAGARFGRQRVVFGWVLDFWCPSRRLIVEVDGGYHRDPEKQAADANRDRVLGSKLGAKTMRFSVDDVLFRPADVHLEIALEVANRPVFRNWNEGLGS
jgi:leucyl-tRNA synthetase